MKEKVDVLQGIAGILWILWFLQAYGMTVFGIQVGEFGSILGLFSALTGLILGIIISLLREEHGIDLFGILSVGFGLLLFVSSIILNIPLYLSKAGYFAPILGIGLILEAFDIIKPIKV